VSWPQVKLERIFEIARGGSPRPIDDYITDADDGLNWISIKDASNSEKYIERTKLKIKPEGLSKTRLVKPGDFLLTNSMSFGRPYIMKTTGCIHDGWLVLSGDPEKVDSDYFYHLLGSDLLKRRFSALAAGAVVKNLNIDLVKGVEIPLPPLPEQKRIAAIFDKADTIRRKRQQAIQLANDFLRAVFLDLFGDPVTNPKGWDEYVLNEIADIRSGVTKGKIVKPEESMTRPYMRVANVQDGYLDLADVQQITVSKKDAEKCLLVEGDILLTEGGDPDKLGRGHVWRGEVEGCLHQNHIFSVRVNDQARVRPAFLSAIISSQRGKRYFLKVGKQTTGIATINKSVLSEFVPFVPPVALQDHYLAVVKRIDVVKKSLAEGDVGLFNSLSQKTFAGQL